MRIQKYSRCLIPLGIGLAIALPLALKVWWGFWIIGPWIGAAISTGWLISQVRGKGDPDLGRRVSILSIVPVFIIFLGIFQRENMQIEETVFYMAYFLSAAIFTRCLIHFTVAKVIGPLIWGRGFCGWACWIAAVTDWLPIKENRPIPKKLTWIRVPVLVLSLLVPLILVVMAFIQTQKFHQFIFFLCGTAAYYAIAVILAFAFRKKRAFCKIVCPVSLVMKLQSKISLIKFVKPSGKPCSSCGACNRVCLMDVDVASSIQAGKMVTSVAGSAGTFALRLRSLENAVIAGYTVTIYERDLS
jgi:ferredoxin-type protein NapH